MKESYPVIEGAEAFYKKGNDIGILISHGFVGTPQSVAFLGEKLAEYGYTVYAPRLKGHGTHYKDLERATYQDWFSDIEAGYKYVKEQCSSVFVVGQSMGGTLALWLAEKYPEVKGLVLINAALRVPGYEYLRDVSAPAYVDEVNPDIKRQDVQEITYDKVPVAAIHQLQTLMNRTPAKLAQINTPVFCFKSTEDHVVPPASTDLILRAIGSEQKEVRTLTNSYHVASLDYDQERIAEETQQFIARNTRGLGYKRTG
ncbi:alpha/beta fold hydrolase [Alkalihalobacillus oceani]|uniref:Alpha/beta fold hydrolase n=1 Tax=Halalkalibacter oceani TaxID=1653776 RepID=A0A9X2DQI3_9BACI|nr:alpha/beta fold hydrolase [Halalkalibacter oceani]MCM3714557.1 alpha/beta fold hydrolase [Halalkalibacter oceani]